MSRLQGPLDAASLFEVIRTIHQERRTGTLRVETESAPKRFAFREGELHLTAQHPLAARVRSILGDSGSGAPELRELVRKVAAAIAGWREGNYSFEEGEVTGELIGPLPTAFLIFAGETTAAGDAELLRRAGGEEARWVAVADPDPARSEELGTAEAFLLSRMEAPAAVSELLAQAGVDRRTALLALGRLEGLDLARRQREEPPAADVVEPLVSPEVQSRFLERIDRTLEQEPLDLERSAHRERLKTLLGQLGGLDHYELLGIAPGSPPEEVHRAYTELARIGHPRHAEQLGLGSRAAGLELLFERATEAYLVLSDPDRRKAYDRAAGVITAITPAPDPQKRHEERRQLARQAYEAAAALAELDDYHPAIQLLQQATSADPRAEYFALLARCQAKNPNWTGEAIRSYERAVSLRPRDPELRAALGGLCEEVGNLERAAAEYRLALNLAPGYPEAVEGLARLRALAGQGGWTKKLFR